MTLILVVLAVLGLAAGSFISALTWRIYEQSKPKHKKQKKLSIVNGRSMCPNCKHELSALDLIPLFSWLTLGGKCRYCKKPISWHYPALELVMAVIFAGSYYFWPGEVNGAGDWLLFVTWLLTSVGLMALLVYDAKHLLLPNRIIYPTAFIAFVGRLVYLIGYEPDKVHGLLQWLFSVAVASGIFWVLFMVSKGKWIGFGDVRLGLITGTVLASPEKSFLMILLASVLGVLFIIPALVVGKKDLASKIPYGPYLIASTIICLLFGSSIIDWYRDILIP